jgi:hypothetical protein
VYDPDPNKSYTKAKLNRDDNRENMTPNVSTNSDAIIFPPDESGLFNKNFTVLPNFVPMDAFQHLKNMAKTSKKT